jgi:hypothetical protein
MTLLLVISGVRLLVKTALFGAMSLLCLYYLYRNLWGTTPIVFLGILALLFLPSAHIDAVYLWMGLLGMLAFLYTLAREIPPIILLRIVVTFLVFSYIGFLTVVAYNALDSQAFTVYISVMYLLWSGWVHDHPLEDLRLRLT